MSQGSAGEQAARVARLGLPAVSSLASQCPFILLRDGPLSRVAFPEWILRDQRPQTPSRPAWPKASLLHVGRQVGPSRQQLLLSGEFSGSQGTRKQPPAVAWAGPAPVPKALHPHASGLTRSGSSEPHLTGGRWGGCNGSKLPTQRTG